MARPTKPAALRVVQAVQTELFPEPVHVEPLDPRSVAGRGTSVSGVYRVTIGHGGEHHLVFRDRYGTYCEVHGRTCPAVVALAGAGSKGAGM